MMYGLVPQFYYANGELDEVNTRLARPRVWTMSLDTILNAHTTLQREDDNDWFCHGQYYAAVDPDLRRVMWQIVVKA